ncbi:DUF2889 domain-containing protein [Desulfococcus sp.]|uniref:DUF2889 domain-containing protein n=1 Tax=Desulfococcus sp. TaxID=2025834 RepID=UPI0035937A77
MEEHLTPVNTEMERRLCTRRKNVDVFLMPLSRQLRVVAEMEDGVHHMRIDMIVMQPSLRITAITSEMLSIPDQVCRQALDCFDHLIGQRVAPGLTRLIRQKAPAGCAHLTNLFHDACYNLTMAQGVITEEKLIALYPGISEAQIYHIFMMFRPDLRNSCIRYADSSPFMEIVDSASLPENFPGSHPAVNSG